MAYLFSARKLLKPVNALVADDDKTRKLGTKLRRVCRSRLN